MTYFDNKHAVLVTNGWLKITYTCVKSGVCWKKIVNNLGCTAVSLVFVELHDFHEFHNLEVSSTFHKHITREKPCIWT